MIFNISTLAVALLATITLALPVIEPTSDDLHARALEMRKDFSSGTLTCETTGGSPMITDLKLVRDQLLFKSSEGFCVQSNRAGSRCSELAKSNDAKVSLCGVFAGSIPCNDAAGSLNEVIDGCGWQGRAGGIWSLGKGLLEIRVHA